MMSVAAKCYNRSVTVTTVSGEQHVDISSDKVPSCINPTTLGMVNDNHYVSIFDDNTEANRDNTIVGHCLGKFCNIMLSIQNILLNWFAIFDEIEKVSNIQSTLSVE